MSMFNENDRRLAKTLGMACRQARNALGLSQQDIGNAIGVTGEFYARIERGYNLPSVPTLLAIANALGLSVDAMLGRTPSSTQATEYQALARKAQPRHVRRLLPLIENASPQACKIVKILLEELQAIPATPNGQTR